MTLSLFFAPCANDRRGTTEHLFASPVEGRFWRKVTVTTANGCLLWTGALNTNGYGVFRVDSRTLVLAHRYAYELIVGSIPAGCELDHECRARKCVNPSHLEPVTHRENVLRGESFAARNAQATHCVNGHAFDAKNTIVRVHGWRGCRACDRQYRLRQRVAA